MANGGIIGPNIVTTQGGTQTVKTSSADNAVTVATGVRRIKTLLVAGGGGSGGEDSGGGGAGGFLNTTINMGG